MPANPFDDFSTPDPNDPFKQAYQRPFMPLNAQVQGRPPGGPIFSPPAQQQQPPAFLGPPLQQPGTEQGPFGWRRNNPRIPIDQGVRIDHGAIGVPAMQNDPMQPQVTPWNQLPPNAINQLSQLGFSPNAQGNAQAPFGWRYSPITGA